LRQAAHRAAGDRVPIVPRHEEGDVRPRQFLDRKVMAFLGTIERQEMIVEFRDHPHGLVPTRVFDADPDRRCRRHRYSTTFGTRK
jgi:hypothetical protein